MNLLRINTDNELKFEKFAFEICAKVGIKFSALAQTSRLISLRKQRNLFKTLIESQFSYCPNIWMFNNRSTNIRVNP